MSITTNISELAYETVGVVNIRLLRNFCKRLGKQMGMKNRSWHSAHSYMEDFFGGALCLSD